MVDMSNQCPRCGSTNRNQRYYKSRRETYKSFGEVKEYYVYTSTYCCNDCGLIYAQEEK